MVPVQCAMTMYEVRPEALLSVIPSLKTVPAWTFQPIKGQKGQRNWPYTTVHSFNFGLEDHFSLNNSSNQRPKRPTELAFHNSPIIYFWPWRLFKLEQFASFIQLKANGIGLKQQSTHLILWYLFSFFFRLALSNCVCLSRISFMHGNKQNRIFEFRCALVIVSGGLLSFFLEGSKLFVFLTK